MQLTTLLTVLTLPFVALSARPKKDAILLSSVSTLTFKGRNALTTARRVPAIPQIKCVSHRRLCNLYQPDVIRCTNQGSSYGDEDVEWTCTASLPRELKLGSTEVICEGYSSSEDPYVLKGSCGVEYTLVLTDEGEEKYPDLAKGSWFGGGGGGGSNGASWVFIVIFLAILGWIIYSARERAAGRDPIRGAGGGRPGWGGGGGGGGWGPGWGPGNDNDPPPPYPGTKPYGTQQAGWRPGFWSGLAGGAAAGYMAGGRRNNENNQRGGSRWGSSAGSSSGSSSFSSGARHQSTGFGSTSRR